jgi:hypothetical protein
VDQLTDTGTGSGPLGDLRYCITRATDGDTIRFTAAGTGTIDLTSALPDLSHNISIKAPGFGQVTVRRNGGGNYSILTVDSQATVSIAGLTLLNGYAPNGGGGLLNLGTTTLNDIIIVGNSATVEGGGIANFGTLAMSKTVVTANLVLGAGSATGGGIYNAGMLDMERSIIANNLIRVARSQLGGGIENSGTLIVNDSSIQKNTADNGGGIDSTGQVTITNSTVAENNAASEGGGLSITDGTVVVSNSTVANNAVTGADGTGGGIVSTGGMLTIGDSTIAGNAIQDGSTGAGGGVAILNDAVIDLSNTIIAGNAAGLGPDLVGQLASSGYNLIGDPTDASGFADTDLLNVDPQLGPLQNNGGHTATMAPACGGPAIDAGDPNFQGPPDTDQRGTGYDRIVNGVVDIGAYEVQVGECGGSALSTGRAVSHAAGPDATPALVLAGSEATLALALVGPVRTPDPSSVYTPAASARPAAEVVAIDRLFASRSKGESRFALSAPMHHARFAATTWALTLLDDEWPLR